MKKVTIFGSTGSIGTQSFDVISQTSGFEVSSLTALKNSELLSSQASKFKSKTHLGKLNSEKIVELLKEAEIVINAVPGFDGLNVSIESLKAGKILLSANKESFVVAGKYLKQIAAETGAEIRPLDSEAFAIWQLLNKYKYENLKSVTLTCSGGPFFGLGTKDLRKVSVEDALKHPTWKMGRKITVDSATLINKVFEVFEVASLFDLALSEIGIIIHRQSLVHGIAHTKTGGTKMNIAKNDMRIPIHYALHHPQAPKSPLEEIDIKKSDLSFDQADEETFRSLKWLKLHKGNPNFPIVLNAMNDLAVKKFLNGEISFLEIYDFIEDGFEKFLWKVPARNLEEVINFHNEISNFYEHSNFISSGKKY